jgi:NAD(P)-dependent dehydrogenase (short-subunit alcohol dehydrogenase family)
VAERLAAAGAEVVAVDREQRVVDEPPGGADRSAVCDVTSVSDVEAVAELVRNGYGRWDILVNSAGTAVFGRAGETSEEDWQRVFDVNARGTWLMCRAALAPMTQQTSGAIVNIASGAGVRPLEGLAAYSASKAAVVSLTRSIAVEYGHDGIRANCITPGMIDTPLHRESIRRLRGGEPQGHAFDLYAVKRLGTSDEIAAAVLYLASPEAGYTTGATLAVDGGRTLH